MSEQRRYPLSWPIGWRRTPPNERLAANSGKTKVESYTSKTWNAAAGHYDEAPATRKRKASLTAADAAFRLEQELDRLGADDAKLSTSQKLRIDGTPRSDLGEPSDVGAAVYFKLKGKDRCLACDRWTRVADNIAAIAQHIDALRRIERYGIGTIDQAFAGYAQLQASPADWWIVLEVSQDATTAQVDDAFRRLARTSHPDAGGSHDQMARLNAARDVAKAAGR